MPTTKFRPEYAEQLRLNLHKEEIARLLGVSVNSVVRWKRRLGIPITNRKPPGRIEGKSQPHLRHNRITINCLNCGSTVETLPGLRARKFCSSKCLTDSEWFKERIRTSDRSYQKPKPHTEKFKEFRDYVRFMTEKTYKEFKEEINPFNHRRGQCGSPGAYQLDHIMSIFEGFTNGIDPEFLSSRINLQMLPWKDNLKKSKQSHANVSTASL